MIQEYIEFLIISNEYNHEFEHESINKPLLFDEAAMDLAFNSLFF